MNYKEAEETIKQIERSNFLLPRERSALDLAIECLRYAELIESAAEKVGEKIVKVRSLTELKDDNCPVYFDLIRVGESEAEE